MVRGKGMRDLIRRLKLNRLTLVSCHPLVREDKFTPLTIGEGELQWRKGTAPAISVAFSVDVESGLDGETCTYIEDGKIELTTGGGDGVGNIAGAEGGVLETSEMALTRYGLTCRKKEADSIN